MLTIELNTRGRNRLVLLTRRWALKIPSLRCWRDFLFGLLNNMNEARWAHEPGMAHCPVAWCAPGGFLLVMPRVRTLGDEEFEELVLSLPPARAERKPDSWGWHNGRLVAVDFGW